MMKGAILGPLQLGGLTRPVALAQIEIMSVDSLSLLSNLELHTMYISLTGYLKLRCIQKGMYTKSFN